MYRYTHLGDLELPYNPISQQDPAAALTRYAKTAAGGFDALLGARAGQSIPYTITHLCVLHNPDLVVVRTEIDYLRGLVGERVLLKRQALDDATEIHVAHARLVNLRYTSNHANVYHQEMLLKISIESRWYGRAHGQWYAETGSDLDSGLRFEDDYIEAAFDNGNTTPLLYTHLGNLPIINPIITFHIGTGDSTDNLRIERVDQAENDFKFQLQTYVNLPLSLVAGDVVKIDFGARVVTLNDTTDLFPHVAFNSEHVIQDWIYLRPTSESGFTIWAYGDSLGANSTVRLSFVEQWA